MTPERLRRLNQLAEISRRQEAAIRRRFAGAVATTAEAALQTQRVEALMAGSGAAHGAVAGLVGAAQLRTMLFPAAQAARLSRICAERERARLEQELLAARVRADALAEAARAARQRLAEEAAFSAFLDLPPARRRNAA